MKSMSWMKMAIGLLVTAAPALASAEQGSATPAALEYEFDEELVSGDLLRPEGETLVGRTRGARQSLVDVRASYVPELLASVEDL